MIAFHKDADGLTEKAICWYTKSKYSHCELIIDGVWFSASGRDSGVRTKDIVPQNGHWDYIRIKCSDDEIDKLKKLQATENGKKYDYTGLWMSQFFKTSIHKEDRWFCSEICAEGLKVIDKGNLKMSSNEYNPGSLFDQLELMTKDDIHKYTYTFMKDKLVQSAVEL